MTTAGRAAGVTTPACLSHERPVITQDFSISVLLLSAEQSESDRKPPCLTKVKVIMKGRFSDCCNQPRDAGRKEINKKRHCDVVLLSN